MENSLSLSASTCFLSDFEFRILYAALLCIRVRLSRTHKSEMSYIFIQKDSKLSFE